MVRRIALMHGAAVAEIGAEATDFVPVTIEQLVYSCERSPRRLRKGRPDRADGARRFRRTLLQKRCWLGRCAALWPSSHRRVVPVDALLRHVGSARSFLTGSPTVPPLSVSLAL